MYFLGLGFWSWLNFGIGNRPILDYLNLKVHVDLETEQNENECTADQIVESDVEDLKIGFYIADCSIFGHNEICMKVNFYQIKLCKACHSSEII